LSDRIAEQWLDLQPRAIQDGVDDWLIDRVETGPPEVSEMIVVIEDYQFRSIIGPVAVIADFIAVEQDRQILIKGFSYLE
jgi:hypothetical protein